MEPRFKKVVFVCNGHDAMLVRWAVGTLADAISKFGVITKVIDLAKGGDERECSNADFVVVYRSFDYRTTRLMRRIRASGGYVVFFLDDYLFQPNCKYTNGWIAPTDFLKEADCFMSSSSVLLSKMESNKPKILRRSVLSGEASALLNQQYRRNPDVFSIGWVAGRGRHGMMDKFIAQFLKELGGSIAWYKKCHFHCFGSRCFPAVGNIDVHENLYFKPEDWRGLYSKCVSFDLGVLINPLDESDEFCHCKSELKFVEAGSMGVPLVTSRVAPYTDILVEGKTGFFASTPREFAEKVVTVMKDIKLSREVSSNVLNMVAAKYNALDNARIFLDDIAKAMKRREV